MGKTPSNHHLATIFGLVLGLSSVAKGACSERTQGPIVIQVQQCSVVDPRIVFSDKAKIPTWLLDMDKASIQRFMAGYKGILVTGLVKQSDAVRTGLLPSKHALKDEIATVFLTELASGCSGLDGRQISGIVTEQCCDGGAEAPCLLDQQYAMAKVRVELPPPAVSSPQPLISQDYRQGVEFFKSGQMNKAIPPLQKAFRSGALDLRGKWILANALEATEDCASATKPLQDIEKAWIDGRTTGKEDRFVGGAMLLLARCYSRSSKASAAVDTLNYFLAHPKKFAKELRVATTHRDFGWINTTGEYRNFLESARRILNDRS